MDIIDYDTEHTLFVAAAAAADSNDAVSNLSISSQRRLIRKPLPEVPESQTAGVVGGQSYILGRTSSPRRNAITLEQSRERAQQTAIEEQKQLDWWPSTLPSAALTEENEKNNDSTAAPGETTIRTFKLNERYRKHLWNIVEASLESLGMPSTPLAHAIFDALEACLETLGDPVALKSLQKSFAFLWRIEALVRSNEQVDGSKVSLKEGGHKWPRLGAWRGGSASFHTNGTSTEARKRKRDVAMSLLSNAFWMTGVGLGDGAFLPESIKPPVDTVETLAPAEKAVPASATASKKAAPQLLMKSSLPTVALHTVNGSEEFTVPSKEELPSSDRASVLTTRLAMQLKSSTGSVRTTSSQSRQKSGRRDEELRMAVCKVCVDFQDDLGESFEGLSARFFPTRRRRSGTITLTAKERREQNNSHGSARSDQTVRVLDKRGDDVTYRIAWRAGRFQGSPLSLNPLSSEDESRDQLSESAGDSRVHLIGGTFLVESWDLSQDEQDIIKDVLDLGLYAACAMMLEGALLSDFGLERRDDAPAEESGMPSQAGLSSNSTVSLETSSGPEMTRASTMDAEGDEEESGVRWKRGIWGIIHYASGENKPGPLRRHATLSRRMKDVQSTNGLPHQAGRFGGYTHKLGKVLDSLTGSSSRRQASTADEAENALRIQGDEENDEGNPVESQVAGDKVKDPSSPLPSRISPNHLNSTHVVPESEMAFMDRLLSEETMSLTVLEGLDMSLPFGKLANITAPTSRASLNSRQSFNDTDGTTTTGSTISNSRSSLSSSKQTRSSSGTAETDALRPPLKHSSNSQATIEATPLLADKAQRVVQYYQRAGASKDISLGQAVEEMAAKARVLDREARASRKPNEKEKETGEEEKSKCASSPPSQTYRVAQYLHSHDRIFVMASILAGPDLTEDVSHLTSSDKGEIAAVAKATQLSQDIVRSAIFLAEHLPDANEPEAGGRSGIEMWSAKVGTEEETRHVSMSEATYLISYGAFIEAILSTPQFATRKHDTARMFRVGNVLLKFQVHPVIVFDLLVEGPVVITHGGAATNVTKSSTKGKKTEEKVLERTRHEIRDFYASMKRHITALEHILVARDLDDKGRTVKAPSGKLKEVKDSAVQEDESFDDSLMEELVSALSSSEPLSLLSRLKKAFRTSEFELYAALKETDAVHVNDMRIRFQHAAKSAKKRLGAWEEKHLDRDEVEGLEPLDYLEPEYFGEKMHAFPGSQFLVREDEPLSIVSYSLSSRAFDQEVHRREQKFNDVLNWQSGVPTTTQSRLSVSSVATSTAKSSTTATLSTLDPDEDGDFDNSEPVQVNMKRKKRTKDTGILSLTLRRVSSNLSSRSGQEVGEGVGGDSEEEDDSNDLLLHEKQDEPTMTPTTSKILPPFQFDTVSSSNDTFKAHVAPVAPKSSLGSMFEAQSTAASTPSQEKDGMSFMGSSTDTESGSGLTIRTTSDASTTMPTPKLSAVEVSKPRITSQQAESRHASTGSTFKAPPPSPHIKQSILSGNLKISCISWFAEDFAKLRQKWNINEDFLQSMSRCKASSVGGGKSKSGFFLTLDGKWIAKQLLNVWSVDEKEAFLEFAPAYLRYMMNSVVNDCPTLLVKIAGVYTLKIKNAKTGETKLKMSVQVLENVFSGDQGDGVRFDIKGIKGRRIPSKKEPTTTTSDGEERAPVWWDAEYLECFQPRAFVPEAHKTLFRRALHNDLAFLTASNIIDYSLLIGVHEEEKSGKNTTLSSDNEQERKEEDSAMTKNSSFCVRIVDFLGAFTLVKYIESSSKKAIRSQTPTVIPPQEYATRFAEAVETYFIPCPR